MSLHKAKQSGREIAKIVKVSERTVRNFMSGKGNAERKLNGDDPCGVNRALSVTPFKLATSTTMLKNIMSSINTTRKKLYCLYHGHQRYQQHMHHYLSSPHHPIYHTGRE